MENGSAYDLFVSYATHNKEIAEYVVQKIEARGARCFIAPRDLRSGREYASEIIRGIECSLAVLLIFSSDSDRSAYVLREINSAVSRNKTIIPLRIENFLPSEAMEFYLGPTHWLDAFPQVLETHLDSVFSILNHKQFVTFSRFADNTKNSRNSRISSLLKLLNLEERHFTNGDIVDIVRKKIYYDNIDLLLMKVKNYSFEYLKEALY